MIDYSVIGKALLHPTQQAILGCLGELGIGGMMSPNELSEQLDHPLGNVSYHVLILAGGTRGTPSKFADTPILELVTETPRRGAVEHYYGLTTAVIVADETETAGVAAGA